MGHVLVMRAEEGSFSRASRVDAKTFAESSISRVADVFPLSPTRIGRCEEEKRDKESRQTTTYSLSKLPVNDIFIDAGVASISSLTLVSVVVALHCGCPNLSLTRPPTCRVDHPA